MGRILIVDDNQQLAWFYEAALRDAGYRTAKAYDGAAALSKIREERFDLIITDINMPNLSGMELLEILIQDTPDERQRTPVIICSGFLEKRLIERYRDTPRVSFLAKPVVCRDLLNRIKQMLEHTKLGVER